MIYEYEYGRGREDCMIYEYEYGKGREDCMIYKMIYEYERGRMKHEESIVHENLIHFSSIQLCYDQEGEYIFSQFNYAMIKEENTF